MEPFAAASLSIALRKLLFFIPKLLFKQMDVIQKSKHWLKTIRWQGRRMLAARRWGSERLNATPAVLANAMPKSGSHLIYQVVQGLCRLGPFVNPGFPPVNRDEFNDKLPDDLIVKN